jgi:hypothetical protein
MFLREQIMIDTPPKWFSKSPLIGLVVLQGWDRTSMRLMLLSTEDCLRRASSWARTADTLSENDFSHE